MPLEPSPYHHGDLREALLNAAIQLVDAEDLSLISLRATARAAGVSHNAPYRHFTNRAELLAAVATQGFQNLSHALVHPAFPAQPPLAEAGLAYLSFARAHPGLYQLMFGPELKLAAFPGLQAAATHSYQQLQASLPDASTPTQALLAWSIVHGLALLLIHDRIPAPPLESPAWPSWALETLHAHTGNTVV